MFSHRLTRVPFFKQPWKIGCSWVFIQTDKCAVELSLAVNVGNKDKPKSRFPNKSELAKTEQFHVTLLRKLSKIRIKRKAQVDRKTNLNMRKTMPYMTLIRETVLATWKESISFTIVHWNKLIVTYCTNGSFSRKWRTCPHFDGLAWWVIMVGQITHLNFLFMCPFPFQGTTCSTPYFRILLLLRPCLFLIVSTSTDWNHLVLSPLYFPMWFMLFPKLT